MLSMSTFIKSVSWSTDRRLTAVMCRQRLRFSVTVRETKHKNHLEYLIEHGLPGLRLLPEKRHHPEEDPLVEEEGRNHGRQGPPGEEEVRGLHGARFAFDGAIHVSLSRDGVRGKITKNCPGVFLSW